MRRRYLARISGETYVMFWPLSRTTPRSGTASPLITRSDGRLARAVRAEQRDGLALLHVEVDAEEHLHRAVREVDVRELQQRYRFVRDEASGVLLLLLEQLLHDEREVVADEARPVDEQRTSDDRARHAE